MTPDDPDIFTDPDLDQLLTTLPAPVIQKVQSIADQLHPKVPEDIREPDFIQKVKRLLKHSINEESTDAIKDIVVGFIPFGMGWLVGWVMDKFLPERFLALTFAFLDRISD